MDNKTTMRRTMLARRKQMAAAPAVFDAAIIDAVLARLPASACLAGYAVAGSELDPQPLIDAARAAGHRLCLPVTLGDATPLGFRDWRSGAALAPDHVGMQAPLPDAMALVPDCVLVPLLAFDAHGGRLGRGGGYYDRTLADLRANGAVLAIGVAHDAQEVDKCPMAPHDQSLDLIVTPSRLLAATAGAV